MIRKLLARYWISGAGISAIITLLLIRSSGFALHVFKRIPLLGYFPYWLGTVAEHIDRSIGVVGLFVGLWLEIGGILFSVGVAIVMIRRKRRPPDPDKRW